MTGKLYWYFESTLIYNYGLTEPFTMEGGAKQGGNLSPLIFLLAIHWTMKECTRELRAKTRIEPPLKIIAARTIEVG